RGVEVVAFARVAVPVGTGVARAPIEELQRRIVRPGQPCCAAAMHPAVARPRFAAWFAGRRHGPEAPRLLAGLRVVGVEKTADAGFAAADADDHFAVHHQRRRGDGMSGRIFADVYRPALDAGTRVEGDEISVERADIHRVAFDRDAAIHAREAEIE